MADQKSPSRTPAILLVNALLLLTANAALSDDANEDPAKEKRELKTSDVGALKWRSIGPALMSGRIADLAIDPVKPNTWYVAAGSGNLWKTANAGTTWQPIFDSYGSYSIGCIAVDSNHRHTIWVGTGENVGGRHVGYGDGVYVSHDGGKSFKNTGLKDSEHLSKILIDPRDSSTVYGRGAGPVVVLGRGTGALQDDRRRAVLVTGACPRAVDRGHGCCDGPDQS